MHISSRWVKRLIIIFVISFELMFRLESLMPSASTFIYIYKTYKASSFIYGSDTTVAYFTKGVNPWLAKRSLVLNGRAANRRSTSLAKRGHRQILIQSRARRIAKINKKNKISLLVHFHYELVYGACDYLSILRFKLAHSSKRGPST